MGSLRPALLAVVVAALVAPGSVQARHSYPATYSGTHSGGGTVEFDVNTDGTYVTRFALTDLPTPCGTVASASGSGATLAAITNHEFTRTTTANGATSFTGSFPALQQASGTLTHKVSAVCSSATVNWTATTAAALPPQCNDGVDNDGDGQTDYPADFSCLSASATDESLDNVAPGVPNISDTDPDPPSNDSTPQVKGSNAEPGSTVKVYGDPSCSGPLLGSGSADNFNGPTGVTATVSGNQATQLRVTATDAANNVSECSSPFAYTHDSIPPSSPTIQGTQPPSPANSTTPQVRGTVGEPAPIVRVYMDPTCSGPQVGQGNDGELGGSGIGVALPPNTTVALRATATDSAGNVSGCSAPFNYTSDSQQPETTITGGPSGATADTTPTFEFSSSEPGSTFGCQVDLAAILVCTSPLTTAPLATGPHTFSVLATDAAGNTDPSPASRSFSVGTTAAPPTGNGTDTSLVLRATAPSPQRALKPKGVIAFAACAAEPCSVRATGYVDIPPAGAAAAKRFRLTAVQRALGPDQRAKLKLRCSARLLRRIRAALRDPSRRRRVRAQLKVKATDTAANTKTVPLKVRIRR